MRRPSALGFCLLVLLAPLARADPAAAVPGPAPVAVYDPTQHWEVDYETGVLWRFSGDATPLTYTFLPQMITVKSPWWATSGPSSAATS